MSEFSFSQQQFTDLVRFTLEEAQRQGATACDVDASEGFGQNVSVRLGEVETIEYNRDKGVGVTVYLGQRKGHASTSDFSRQALTDSVSAALAIARYTAEDEFAGLADPALFATSFPDFDLYHPWALPVEAAIELAKECEAAGQAVDERISNSEGGSVSTSASRWVYANSLGFIGHGDSTRHSISAALIAEDASGMQRDYWYTSARAQGDLDGAAAVGRRAGERAVRRLGARRIKTGDYPVLFEAPVAGSLISHWVSAISGSSLYRKSSFLLDSLGQQVFSPIVQIVEDPFLLRGQASGAFDAEGVATTRRDLVSAGVLNGYFLSSYSARKLGMATTANAGGPHNLLVQATASFEQLLQQLGTGLLVTELLGHGINMVTGDYSRGAAGFWVENGVIQYAVEEITIAGNLRDIFKGIVGIGDDIVPGSSKRVGSILIDKLTVAGE
ncbi:Metalloprotease PmbA [Andreprevotia sp. IGB-42]|uniref:metalloprotease PmbA n=1 Tax=Andreprevotia sp. IGB-42 TaxID=2497473 RepID=UPI00135B6C00|nr:metalloprotease PmbA [Andreprevotia sp. IGB-42]KAF0814187.1 Metalloprotease PmbA [Andreprevotia sp. IGB-42]